MKDFSKLPDSMEPDELECCFFEFFKDANDLCDSKLLFVFKQLYELSFRQLYTYELLRKSIRERVSAFILNNLDYESFEIMDYVMHIIPLLGLDDVFNKIISDKHTIANFEVKNLIEKCKNDYGDNVSDPLFGFKQP